MQGSARLTAVDRLTIDGRSVRLTGIRSGGMGHGALNTLVRNAQPVHCSQVSGDAYRCVTADGDDIAEVAVLNGLARASGPDYQDAEYTARETKAGLWGGGFQ